MWSCYLEKELGTIGFYRMAPKFFRHTEKDIYEDTSLKTQYGQVNALFEVSSPRTLACVPNEFPIIEP